MFAITDVMKFKATAIVVGVLLVVIFGVVTYYKANVIALESTVRTQRTQIGELEVSVSTLESANKLLKAYVETQNLKIDTMLRTAKEASTSAAKSIASAQVEASKWKAKYKKVLFAPPVSKDECTDLSLKVDAYLKLRVEGGL